MRKERRRELRDSWAQLTRGRSFVLACHQRPDGDALGSALALARVLRGQGKDVVVVCEDGVPDNYRFIPDSDTVLLSTNRRGFDVGVLVDCESVKRIGSAKDALLSSSITACIDHHLPNGEFGDIRIIDPEASATAELVFELFSANGIPIDRDLATQLMAGIVGDTGAFKFANTNARTFRIASRLAAAGARASDIAREIYESHSLPAMRLLGRALCSLTMHPSGRIVWAQVTKKDLDELDATDADTEGIVNLVRWVKGPDVAILFRETKPGSIRISLRSTDDFDVERIARVFGGGGHKAAAGCTIEGSLDSARELLIGEVLKWMESST
ncbi:MAG: bifunctional oligoribonuclease/PAP phosphatase NrnA [Armatimonadota bacterium]|nr:bifunctional oligoribonuclease/PAP phosphatase NrnA [Armatimonadota bacterium]